MKALLFFSKCLMRLHCQPKCSMAHAANPQPHEQDFLGLYLLCIWEISSTNPGPQGEKRYCLFFCSRIERKVFLSCCMKQDEQGDDLQTTHALPESHRLAAGLARLVGAPQQPGAQECLLGLSGFLQLLLVYLHPCTFRRLRAVVPSPLRGAELPGDAGAVAARAGTWTLPGSLETCCFSCMWGYIVSGSGTQPAPASSGSCLF